MYTRPGDTTIDYNGVDLTQEMFEHGQVYVAFHLRRVHRFANLKLPLPSEIELERLQTKTAASWQVATLVTIGDNFCDSIYFFLFPSDNNNYFHF